jgi:hypothetical protein
MEDDVFDMSAANMAASSGHISPTGTNLLKNSGMA